jgi:UDP-N-acetylglucosamine--N-acetylmuramyl-(pentapeptide) pyrophosphoryl-undecaprenol N-acetylglucosamine transferase
VIVARAGAISVSELCNCCSLPAILVPLPSAAEDHQTRNALALAQRDAAVLVPDAQTRELLGQAVLDLVGDGPKRLRLANNARALGLPDAADRIAEEVIRLGQRHALQQQPS